MWTRAQLKEKAKAVLKLNYWKMVLVALILTLLMGGGAGNAGALNSTDTSDMYYEDEFEYGDEYEDDYGTSYDDLQGILGDDMDLSQEEYEELMEDMMGDASVAIIFLGIFLVVFLIVFVVALGIGLVMAAFITNPIEVGCNRFFLKALEKPAQVKEVAFAFDNSYKNIVKVMFHRTLYTMLWSFLFIIPGIVKSYEYRMIPYLLAENPNLTKEQAFALSKQMMMGQKWSAFVLDLSFFGWQLLSLCTIGILDIFYVAPYMHATNAALYEELSHVYGCPAQNAYVTAVDQYQTVFVTPEQTENEQVENKEE